MGWVEDISNIRKRITEKEQEKRDKVASKQTYFIDTMYDTECELKSKFTINSAYDLIYSLQQLGDIKVRYNGVLYKFLVSSKKQNVLKVVKGKLEILEVIVTYYRGSPIDCINVFISFWHDNNMWWGRLNKFDYYIREVTLFNNNFEQIMDKVVKKLERKVK